MQAEIVVIGTELLLGQIIDTNGAYLAQQLSSIGIDLYYKSAVGDNKGRIVETLAMASARSDLVITTGGIGPTLDDMTRESVAEVLGVPLHMQPHLLEQIKGMMGTRYTENNARQAYIPTGALAIENAVGTAPGFIAPTPRGGAIVSLPGVPGELRYLMEHKVMPHLKERFHVQSIIASRTLKCMGLTESYIDETLDDLIQQGTNPTIGLLAQMQLGEIHVRLTAKAADEAAAMALIAPLDAQVRQRLGKAVFGTDEVEYEQAVAELLRQHDLSIAVAESGLSGGVGHQLATALADGRHFAAAVTAHLPAALEHLLDVPEALLQQHGQVSPAVAAAMARGVRRRNETDLGLAVTGAERLPGGQDTVAYIALAHGNDAISASEYRRVSSMRFARQRIGRASLQAIYDHLMP
ncbi:MAG: CinA family nicotinamide mononucleotide deamidase-related protein [Candidatus Tectomicrobia bacterium]|uniref:CinA-like protein n=1 Tax=Tectimicrobiota bacterium TaxID=2528274 RepID=A0A937W255_UNCTE|nr:CinA family nicotinamide mononucleotide deamidase-related protein [Candidatus Tectomicrobia bacterium]